MTSDQIAGFFRSFREPGTFVRLEDGRWTTRHRDDAPMPVPDGMEAALNKLFGQPYMLWRVDITMLGTDAFKAEIIPQVRDIERLLACEGRTDLPPTHVSRMDVAKVAFPEPMQIGEREVQYVYVAGFSDFAAMRDVMTDVLMRELLCATAELGVSSPEAAQSVIDNAEVARKVNDPELNLLIDALRKRAA